MRPEDAKWLFEWSGPVLPASAEAIYASPGYPGIWVLVHDWPQKAHSEGFSRPSRNR